MKTRRIIWLVFAVAIFNSIALADSPLTSTSIAFAYEEEPIVKLAAKSKGTLTNELMEYLVDSKNPIDIKIAVIDRLGTNIKGTKNSQIYFAFLLKKHGYPGVSDFLQKASSHDLLTMAYVRALSDYFRVKTAVVYADKALSLNPNSRTFNLIRGLIKAQDVMDDMSQWCEVFQITDRIRKNTDLTNDIREAAVKNIYKYMDGYGEYCGSESEPTEGDDDLPPPSISDWKLTGIWTDSAGLSEFVNPGVDYIGEITIGSGQTMQLFQNTRYSSNTRNNSSNVVSEINSTGTFSADEKYLTFKNASSSFRKWDPKTRKLISDTKSVLPSTKYRYKLEAGEKPGEKTLLLWSPEDEAKYPNSPTTKFWLRK